jgi:hypothetical protein
MSGDSTHPAGSGYGFFEIRRIHRWRVVFFCDSEGSTLRLKIPVLLLTLIVAQGCAFRQHGRFCGPGYPKLAGTLTKEQRIAELEKLAPVDDIDAACKQHDLCYQQKGFADESCDDELKAAIAALKMRMGCFNAAGDISTWFIAFHPSVTTGEWVDAFGKGFGGVIALPFSGVLVGLHGVMQLFGRAGRDEVCCDRTSFLLDAAGPCYPHGVTDLRLRVMHALIPHASEQRLFYEPGPPAALERTARQHAQVPDGEQTLAFLTDRFLLREAIVFTDRAMYFKTTGENAGRLSYDEISDFDRLTDFDLQINHKYKASMMGMDPKDIATVIKAVRDAVLAARDGSESGR